VAAVAARFMQREFNHRRSAKKREGVIANHILPVLGPRSIDTIKRSEINDLLWSITQSAGPHAAQAVLVALTRLFNWWATQSDDFKSPIVPGMSPLRGKNYARERVLTDEELRAFWRATVECGTFGSYCRFLLLTACRKSAAGGMTRAELSTDGTLWTVPAARADTKLTADYIVPLSAAAREVLAQLPTLESGRVFWDAIDPGFDRLTDALRVRMVAILGRVPPKWTLHDVRRSAATRMADAGVASDVIERCLGHKLHGVAAVYNRSEHLEAKRVAFEKLASEIARVVSPTAETNVVPLQQAR
jgi:integrase